jgi:hypothetical protein
VTNFNDHSFIGAVLSYFPFMFDQAQGGFDAGRCLWFAALETNPAQLSKSALSNTSSWRKRFEIAIVAHENGVIHFRDRCNERIGRVRGKLGSKQNNLMSCRT